METKDIIAQLLKQGAKKVDNLIIRSVTVTPQQEYVRLGITLDTPVDGYQQNPETLEYESAKVNVIFVSAFSIAALLRDMEEAAFAANHLLSNPEGLGIILSRAKINIIQEHVAKGTEYSNPFSSDSSVTKTFDHDAIINHIVSITLSEFGIKRLDKLADKMMGF